MSERKFTAEERKRIAQVFRHAKNKLWNGRLDTPIGDKCVSICRAIDECGFLIGHLHAITVIHSRLGPTRPVRSLRDWLIEQGIPPGFITDHRLQEHRHAWLDMLIEEFSQPEQRLIYACHCGCPRIRREASVWVNDPDELTFTDGVDCPECNYDGRKYFQVPVDPDFDLEDNLTPAYVEKHGTEVIL